MQQKKKGTVNRFIRYNILHSVLNASLKVFLTLSDASLEVVSVRKK